MLSVSSANITWPTRQNPITAHVARMSRGNSPSGKLFAIAPCVENQALEAVSQKQPAAVSFSLRDERQKHVPHFRRDSVCLKKTQGFGEIQHLRDRRWLLQFVAAQRMCEAGQLTVQAGMLGGRPQPQDLGFPLDRRVVEAKVQGAPPQRIADPPLFVRGHHYNGLAFGLDRPKLRNADLPLPQNLK